jgi:hypothetical protein
MKGASKRNMRHFRFEQLCSVVDGNLPPDERATADVHLSECDRCRADLLWLRGTAELMRPPTMEEAPAELVARAVRLFQPYAAPGRESIRRRIVAVLAGGGFMPAFGLRGTEPHMRQLLYTAGEHGIDIRLTPTQALWTLTGQLLGPADGGEVRLEGVDGERTTKISPDGAFSLTQIAPGTYTLRLTADVAEIEVLGLEIGG